MKTICFCNQKGGVGKTSIAINMAYFLSNTINSGLRVLYIDNDEQGNGTDFFGGTYENTLADLLLGKKKIEDIIQPTRYKGIDLISCNDDMVLAALEVQKNDNIIQQDILQILYWDSSVPKSLFVLQVSNRLFQQLLILLALIAANSSNHKSQFQ